MDEFIPEILVFFGLGAAGGDFFTLDDPVKGKLDFGNLLAGDVGSDISGWCRSWQTSRGRARQTDTIDAGTATLTLDNTDGVFDPLNPGSPFYPNVTIGAKLTIKAFGQFVFVGQIDDIQAQDAAYGDSIATITAVDALTQLANSDLGDWPTTAGQTAGPRISEILDRVTVAFPPNRAIDTGISTLQGDTVTSGTNTLQYMQLVSLSDYGHLYAARDGLLTFRDRHATLNATTALSFNDTGSGIPFSNAVRASAAELITNQVTVSRVGGSTEIFIDTDSKDMFGPHSISYDGLLLETDGQSVEYGEYVLGLLANPEPRVKQITVDLGSLNATQRSQVCAIDLTSVLFVSWVPQGFTAPLSKYLLVEGVDHDATAPVRHEVILALGSMDDRTVFTLDHPIFGVLDAGNVLTF